jgi:hypothetical protein
VLRIEHIVEITNTSIKILHGNSKYIGNSKNNAL